MQTVLINVSWSQPSLANHPDSKKSCEIASGKLARECGSTGVRLKEGERRQGVMLQERDASLPVSILAGVAQGAENEKCGVMELVGHITCDRDRAAATSPTAMNCRLLCCSMPCSTGQVTDSGTVSPISVY